MCVLWRKERKEREKKKKKRKKGIYRPGLSMQCEKGKQKSSDRGAAAAA